MPERKCSFFKRCSLNCNVVTIIFLLQICPMRGWPCSGNENILWHLRSRRLTRTNIFQYSRHQYVPNVSSRSWIFILDIVTFLTQSFLRSYVKIYLVVYLFFGARENQRDRLFHFQLPISSKSNISQNQIFAKLISFDIKPIYFERNCVFLQVQEKTKDTSAVVAFPIFATQNIWIFYIIPILWTSSWAGDWSWCCMQLMLHFQLLCKSLKRKRWPHKVAALQS